MIVFAIVSAAVPGSSVAGSPAMPTTRVVSAELLAGVDAPVFSDAVATTPDTSAAAAAMRIRRERRTRRELGTVFTVVSLPFDICVGM